MTRSPGAGSTLTPAWKNRPRTLVRAVTGELVSRIVRGVHAPGSSLPPEPVLAETFGVSRTVVREAMMRLEEKGLVQVRQGSGTVVSPSTQWDILDELVLSSAVAGDDGQLVLEDLVVTRRLLEADMASVAARLADAATTDQLNDLVDQMDGVVDDPDAYAELDRRFHDTIMRASGNRIALAVVRSLESQVVNTARYLGRPQRSLCVASNRGHRLIAERVAAGDPAGAADAMFTHITEAWQVRRRGPAEPDRLRR